PISADRILVCTFMSAAAEEMRSRIEKRLGEEYLASPDNRRLYEQRLKIKNAKICTIDSFCIELIRENFDALGIAPDFSIGDDISVSKIKEQALGSVLNEEFSNNSPEFVALLNALCSRFDETDLKDAIISVYNYSQNLPFPREWLNAQQRRIDTDEYVADIISDTYSELEKIIKSAKERLKKITEKLLADEQLYSSLAPTLSTDIELFEGLSKLIDERDWNELLIKIGAASFSRWPTIKNCESPLKDAAKQIRDASKDDFSKIKDIVYAPECEIVSDIKASLTLVKKLITLVVGYTDKFEELCRAENVVTFSQAEHLALDLLCETQNGEIKLLERGTEIINRFDEVLVDEFQDINDMQDLLFGILSQSEKNLFAVGDVKQSIYGFRGSNPNNFLNKKNAFPLMESENQTGLKKVILSSNFRSRKGVCDFANYLFSLLMNGEKSHIKYGPEEALSFAATYPETSEASAEMHFIDIDAEELTATEYEAEYLAQYIKKYIENGKVTDGPIDNQILRKPRFGDFAILLRGVKSKGAIYMKALKENGIPVNFSAESPFDSSEVNIALALLTIISNPSRDIELVSVLMSPLFGFTADEMAEIRAASRKTTFISAVSNASKNGNAKATDFLKKLNLYRTASVTMGVGDLLDYLYEQTELMNIVSALENGAERRANLENLYAVALDFQNTQPTKNALLFVDFIRKQSVETVAEATSGNENAVKILTIHKSKGLQYPVCILADTQKRFSGEDSRKNLLVDSEKGIGFRYFDFSENAKKESLHYKLI
ncbi:MAG: UvrD-helicase domain-containing protein, partial [Clostridia bacterium]|nr:UvrD-helicase domain-containing protein [Clostridia bacterium]